MTTDSTPEYTPTTEQVREVFLLGAIDAADGEENLDIPAAIAMFDRWLESERAAARQAGLEQGWDEGAAVAVDVRIIGDRYVSVVRAPSPANPYRAAIPSTDKTTGGE